MIKTIPKVILVGDKFNITGLNFTAGSEVNLFIATAGGVINGGPLIPASRVLPTQLTVDVPATVPLGKGFVDVQVVNTDKGFLTSNSMPALLQADPATGLPTITSINGVGLAATSSDPSYATNNVQDRGGIRAKSSRWEGIGFQDWHQWRGGGFDFCACPGRQAGAVLPEPDQQHFDKFHAAGASAECDRSRLVRGKQQGNRELQQQEQRGLGADWRGGHDHRGEPRWGARSQW